MQINQTPPINNYPEAVQADNRAANQAPLERAEQPAARLPNAPTPILSGRFNSMRTPSALTRSATAVLSGISYGADSCYNGLTAVYDYFRTIDPQIHRNLLLAATAGDSAGVETALQNRASTNYRDSNGMTPLHQAAKGTSTHVVRQLIAAGAAPAARANDRSTPLHLASAFSPSVYILLQLIRAGADVNATNTNGRTPLHEAVESRLEDDANIDTLLKHPSININTRDTLGRSPLYYAIRQHKNSRASLLINKTTNLNQTFENGETLLMHALRSNNMDMVHTLIEKGANIHLANNSGQTLLHLAIDLERPNLVSHLLQKDASIYAKDYSGKTALHYAAAKPNLSVAEPIIDLVKGQNRVMRFLYSPKWYIDQPDRNGQTALHVAYEHGNNDMIELLKNLQANESIIDLDGRFPAARAHMPR